jgi:hypothetical protein
MTSKKRHRNQTFLGKAKYNDLSAGHRSHKVVEGGRHHLSSHRNQTKQILTEIIESLSVEAIIEEEQKT